MALKDVNFSMKQGEFVFLCGPSGAGKTTFMRILHGALPVQRGKADVAGHDLNRLSESRKHLLRRDVSVVFQDFKILPDQTVFANVELPLRVRGIARHIIDKRVRAVLRSMHLERKAGVRCEARCSTDSAPIPHATGSSRRTPSWHCGPVADPLSSQGDGSMRPCLPGSSWSRALRSSC